MAKSTISPASSGPVWSWVFGSRPEEACLPLGGLFVSAPAATVSGTGSPHCPRVGGSARDAIDAHPRSGWRVGDRPRLPQRAARAREVVHRCEFIPDGLGSRGPVPGGPRGDASDRVVVAGAAAP